MTPYENPCGGENIRREELNLYGRRGGKPFQSKINSTSKSIPKFIQIRKTQPVAAQYNTQNSIQSNTK